MKNCRKVTVYFDGLCEPRNPRGVAAYGYVIYVDGVRFSSGRGLAAEPWSEMASNNVAEYTALIQALKWLLENGYMEVVVRGDSQLVIRQMTGRYAVRASRIIPLYERAVELASKFRSVRFEWVPRDENWEADYESELAYADYWRKCKIGEAEEIEPGEVAQIAPLKFRVRGYIVDLEAYTCQCPDYRRVNRKPRLRVKLPCKHIIAAEKIGRKPSPRLQ